MALIQCNYRSSVLSKAVNITIIVPEDAKRDNLRVLYLLHGIAGDNSVWTRYSSLERYIRFNSDTLIVMPDAEKSFYTDMVYGEKYYTYITEELPMFLKKTFHISQKREDTYIAGLSMGGYGAFKIALKNPEKFFAAASFSGALDIFGFMNLNPEKREFSERILGKDYDTENNSEDLMYLLEKDMLQKPKLFQTCGTEDYLYQSNIKFRDRALKNGFDLKYMEAPGEHNWDFWDWSIKYALDFFEIKNQ